MIANVVIVPVDRATPWINSLVVSQSTKADGTIYTRACLDSKNLNNIIIREPCYYWTINHIIPKLAGMKYIRVTDMKSGNLLMPLDEEIN